MKNAIKAQFSQFGLGLAGAVLAVFMALPAQAVPVPPTPPYSVFTFAGNCQDCAVQAGAEFYPVTAALTLQNYLPGSGGSPVPSFFSLSYGGSNLIDAFTLHVDAFDNLISAPFGYGPAFVYFHVAGKASETSEALDGLQLYFRSYADGSWNLGYGDGQCTGEDGGLNCFTEDIGNNGQWTFLRTVLPQTNDVPEPGSLLLMGGALVVLALVRRRNKA